MTDLATHPTSRSAPRHRGQGRADGGSTPDPQDRAQLAAHPVSLRRIGALFLPYRWRLLGVIGLIVTSSALSLATPFLTRHLIDEAIPRQDVPLLLGLVAGMLLVTVVANVLGVLQTWHATTVGQRVMHGLRTDVFRHLQRPSLDFFTRTRAGQVQSRFTHDISAMQSVVSTTATSVAANVTTAVGTAIAMVALSWQLSLLSLLGSPPAVWRTRKVATMRREATSRRQSALADLQGQVEEPLSVSGVLLAKTLGAGPTLARRFEQSSADLLDLEVRAQLAGRWRMATMSIVFAAVPALIYLVAGLPLTGGDITIGTLVAFIALQAGIFRPLTGLLSVGVQVIGDPPRPATISAPRGHLRMDGVSFRYPGADRDALAGVSLDVPAGTHLALVGESGSGKTTLAGLVARLHDPTSGHVTIDGVDLRALSLGELSGIVGVVSQETYLLHTTVRENLRYARPGATDAEIEDAARAAQVHDLITSLPEGYETVVGSRGHRFSGGEKQRLAIARTLLRDPRVLVLDEATSALDNETERAVQSALEVASRGRTTLTIAHRLSTVTDADRIVVLEHGRVVETGRHEELLMTGGTYATLARGAGGGGVRRPGQGAGAGSGRHR